MPAALPKPPKELLYELYVTKRMSYREIMKQLDINTARAIKRWLIEYEIPIRKGSEAIKTQWENNEERRIKQSGTLKGKVKGNEYRRLSDDVYAERLLKKKLKLLRREIIDSYTVVELECMVCNNTFTKHARNLNRDGCPMCKISKGEMEIKTFLEEHGISFEREYTFDDCRNVFPLKFDFAIFKDGILFCLIEYDGEFHFKNGYSKTKSSKGKGSLSDSLKRDLIKNQYCKKKKIKLIRISFINFKNIREILSVNLLEQPSLF